MIEGLSILNSVKPVIFFVTYTSIVLKWKCWRYLSYSKSIWGSPRLDL